MLAPFLYLVRDSLTIFELASSCLPHAKALLFIHASCSRESVFLEREMRGTFVSNVLKCARIGKYFADMEHSAIEWICLCFKVQIVESGF